MFQEIPKLTPKTDDNEAPNLAFSHQTQENIEQDQLPTGIESHANSCNPIVGWEMAVDSKGRVFFVDHVNKKTTWEDPR